jgi:hypothetical protein
VAYNFQTGKTKIKLLTKYESLTQEVLFGNAVHAALMYGRKYDVIPNKMTVQERAICVLWFFETKSVIKKQRRYKTQYGNDPPSDNAIRRWLKQFQETGSVLHRKGVGRPSTS